MNGECKSYRLNEPMAWPEFKALPDDIKVTYIKLIRERFGVSDKEIADMFGVDRQTVGKWFRCLGLGLGKQAGGKKEWDNEKWFKWRSGDKVTNTEPEETTVTETEVPLPCPDEFHCDPNQTSKDNDATEATEATEEPEVIPNHFADVGKKVEQKPAIPIRGELTFCGSAEDALRTAAVLLGGGKCSDKSFVGGHRRCLMSMN